MMTNLLKMLGHPETTVREAGVRAVGSVAGLEKWKTSFVAGEVSKKIVELASQPFTAKLAIDLCEGCKGNTK